MIQGGIVRWSEQGLLVRLLLPLCGLVFILQTAGVRELEAALWLSRIQLGAGEIWRVFSYSLLHGGIWHLFFNMLVLWMFVPPVLSRVGQGRLALVMAAAVVAGGLAHTVFSPFPVVGISAAIYALLAMTAWFWPRQTVLVFFVIPMPMYLFVIVLAGIEFLMTMQPGSMTAHWAHLGGGVTGLAAAVFLARYHSKRVVSRSRRPGIRERIGFFFWKRKLARRNATQARVDALLEKISKTGLASLTTSEKRFLDRSSKDYRTD